MTREMYRNAGLEFNFPEALKKAIASPGSPDLELIRILELTNQKITGALFGGVTLMQNGKVPYLVDFIKEWRADKPVSCQYLLSDRKNFISIHKNNSGEVFAKLQNLLLLPKETIETIEKLGIIVRRPTDLTESDIANLTKPQKEKIGSEDITESLVLILADVDELLTANRLAAYDSSSHFQHLTETIGSFLEKTKDINPLCGLSFDLSDIDSRLQVRVDPPIAGNRDYYTLKFELKSSNSQIRENFERLKKDLLADKVVKKS
ncbi:MAG: hypothetical protein HY094_06810 [Candidatus Melainabacteria bacterium]|nr:hypothetical protein [Candidatus Melainabacteria bacterium]